jgi:hypothetical protein
MLMNFCEDLLQVLGLPKKDKDLFFSFLFEGFAWVLGSSNKKTSKKFLTIYIMSRLGMGSHCCMHLE